VTIPNGARTVNASTLRAHREDRHEQIGEKRR